MEPTRTGPLALGLAFILGSAGALLALGIPYLKPCGTGSAGEDILVAGSAAGFAAIGASAGAGLARLLGSSVSRRFRPIFGAAAGWGLALLALTTLDIVPPGSQAGAGGLLAAGAAGGAIAASLRRRRP